MTFDVEGLRKFRRIVMLGVSLTLAASLVYFRHQEGLRRHYEAQFRHAECLHILADRITTLISSDLSTEMQARDSDPIELRQAMAVAEAQIKNRTEYAFIVGTELFEAAVENEGRVRHSGDALPLIALIVRSDRHRFGHLYQVYGALFRVRDAGVARATCAAVEWQCMRASSEIHLDSLQAGRGPEPSDIEGRVRAIMAFYFYAPDGEPIGRLAKRSLARIVSRRNIVETLLSVDAGGAGFRSVIRLRTGMTISLENTSRIVDALRD